MSDHGNDVIERLALAIEAASSGRHPHSTPNLPQFGLLVAAYLRDPDAARREISAQAMKK